MVEEWRDIAGYEGLYQVSNLGRVRSLERKNCVGKRIRERVLGTYYDTKGYAFVHLFKTIQEGKSKKRTVRVHRLVADAFIPNLESKPEIDHIDGNTKNNRSDNLRWCTRSENIRNPICTERQRKAQTGLKKCPEWFKKWMRENSPCRRGKDNNMARAVINVETGKRFDTVSEAAKSIGKKSGNVSDALRRGHRTGGYHWRYA